MSTAKREIERELNGIVPFKVEDNLVCCAHCGETYGLHHDKVTTFERICEDGPGVVTTIDSSSTGVILSRLVEGNSHEFQGERRNGLTVEFWCECCGGARSVLSIWQHKGVEQLSMYAVPSEEGGKEP